MKLTILSFNVQHCLNYVTRKIDFDLFADLMRYLNADIIGLNEIRGQGESEDYQAQAQILAKKLGYHYYFAKAIDVNGNNPYGDALLSKYPISHAETILIPDPIERKCEPRFYETRCILKAVVETPIPVTVLVSHFGLNPDEQLLAKETVIPLLENSRCLLMGDFNITPDNDIIHEISQHMTDTAAQGPENMLSFPSFEPTEKIDYIFTSSDIRTQWAEVLPIIASDHRPYIAHICIE